MDDIEDPVVGNARAGVEARLRLPIRPVGAISDLDNEHGVCRMRVSIGGWIARDHGHIRFGLRVIIERDRKLRVDLPVIAERFAERRQHSPDRGGVATSLGFANDEQAVEQLQAFAGLKYAKFDQALVFHASPTSESR